MDKVSTRRSLRVYQAAGLLGLVLVLGSLGGWAALASIQGAVIAPGMIVVESNVKRVQHQEGGIVAEIHVDDGDRVEEGDLLVRLDDTATRAELAVIESMLDESEAKRARLIAESDHQEEVRFPESLVARQDVQKIAEMMAGQNRYFASQKAALEGRKEQLTERIAQTEREIEGLEAQMAANKDQIGFVRLELADLKELRKQGLVRVNRIHGLERERARLEGEIGQLTAQIARAESRIGETKLQIISLEDDALSESLAELRETEARISELQERRHAARSRLSRTSIVAPRTGYVHQVNVHTIGGVVGSGETMMMIVPDLDDLVIEARVNPNDIDDVVVGQSAVVRFTAFSSRRTPELNGEVIHVSADLTRPVDDSPPYYGVRLRLPLDQIQLLGENNKLKPGMPADAFIQTGARTPLNYLLKPLSDQIAHTFREG